MKRFDCHRLGSTTNRQGFLLLVVLAVLVLLSLACYEFADRFVAEREASAKAVQLSEARLAALSGIDYIVDVVSSPDFTPELFADVEWMVEQPIDETERVGFTIMPIDSYLAAWPDDPSDTIYGVVSESGKINVNALAELGDRIEESAQREILLQLPGMSESIADTILDFIDSDAEARTFGTESDSGNVTVRNRPLDSLDDLLVLPEVDSLLLYGTDFNFNGRADETEEVEGAEAGPGLSSYLTVHGREANVDSTGEPRIDLNQDDIDTMEADVSAVLGEDVASYVRAYREEGSSSAQQARGAFNRLSRVFGPLNVGSSINLSGEIQALADLIDSSVGDGSTTSPLVSTDLTRLLELYDYASTTDAETIAGRIDINSTTPEILVAMASVEESVATAITSRNDWVHPVELLTSGVVDVTTFRELEPLLTTDGGVYSFSSIGYVEGGPMVRVDAIVDTTVMPPRILKQVDMTRVGIGRTLEMVRPSKIGLED